MRNLLPLSILLVAASVLCWPAATLAAPETGAESSCILSPDHLRLDTETPSIEVEVAASVGEVKNVEVEADSGLKVVEIGAEDRAVLRLTLDTREATSGTWQISIEGEAGTCTASLTVDAA